MTERLQGEVATGALAASVSLVLHMRWSQHDEPPLPAALHHPLLDACHFQILTQRESPLLKKQLNPFLRTSFHLLR
jgi:hypothetical protein